MTIQVVARRSPAEIDYTNYRGERRWRRIWPGHIWYGVNEWHKTPCSLLTAIDDETGKYRDFAVASIHEWRDLPSIPLELAADNSLAAMDRRGDAV